MRSDLLAAIRLVPFLASAWIAGLANADTWAWMNDPAAYGYFCQYSIPNTLAGESCAPASATNALQFVQSSYGDQLGGVELVGSGYAGWNQTAQTLQVFFGTTEDQTTSGPGMTAGLGSYLESIGASNLLALDAIAFDTTADHPGEEYPDWVQQGTTPTFLDFHDWMSDGAGVYFNILYAANLAGDGYEGDLGGHVLAMVGLEWDDADGDGVVDQDEGARFLAIDPLDPSQHYSASEVLGPAKITELAVWQEQEGGLLQFSYLQYVGALPFDGSNYATASGFVAGGLAISVIPAPATWVVAMAIGAFGSRRRRSGESDS
jgi:hypothetical protein